MKALLRLTFVSLVLAAAPLLAQSKGAFLEKTVDVPRDFRVPVELSYEKARIVSVESAMEPKEKDVKNASEKDTQIMMLRFYYENPGYVKHKVTLKAVLLDEAGGVVADGSGTRTLDAKTDEDTVSFFVKVKTVDWPRAKQMKVFATFLN
ncbi:MAG: hypothetical protein JNK60_01655 [Acidobacteria bacterium]|nr:hypothetical protein [Acidobacteriota bacterium]